MKRRRKTQLSWAVSDYYSYCSIVAAELLLGNFVCSALLCHISVVVVVVVVVERFSNCVSVSTLFCCRTFC